MEPQDLNGLNHEGVEFWVGNIVRFLGSNLFGKDLDVFVEGFGGTHVSSCDAGLSWSTGCKFTLFKDEGQEREERMTVNGILVSFVR